MNSTVFETLESRTLLAGVTMLTHGWNGSITQWIATAAQDITAELGGPAQAPQYILTLNLDTNDGALIPSVTHVAGSGTPQTSTSGQIILILDWESVSTNAGYSLAGIASVFTNYMLNNDIGGVNVTQLPIHEIAQSRGVGMDDAIAQSLGESGVWINQETYLDAHTIGVMNDPPPTLYSNVEFADDYWRTDGNPADDAENGQPVAGAYNLNIYWLDGDSAGYTSVHDATTGYYVGTIDTTGTWGGDGPIISNWYGDTPTMPARTATGFYYSSIDGGARPVSGLWPASGGTGTRTATGQSGQQWPNVSDLAVTNGQSFASGNAIDLSYIQQDRGDTDTITYYLDTDANPYNGTGIQIGTQSGIAASESTNNGTFSSALSGVAPGTYYICAEVANAAGLIRYDYAPEEVTVTGAVITVNDPARSNPAVVVSNGTHLLVDATDSEGSPLTYTWTFTHLPAGAAKPSISANGTTSNKLLVTFYKQGGYAFICTISDAAGTTTTSTGSVDVVETPTKLVVTPANTTVARGHARRFSTTVINQFGHTMDATGVQYSIVRGPATITASGIFNASDVTGTALVSVDDDGLSEVVDAYVVN